MEVVQARDGTNSTKTQPGRAKTVKKCRQEMVADPRATQRSPTVMDVRVTSLHLPGLDVINSLAVTRDGTCLVCTPSALYTLLPSGLPTLLAGHRTERGFQDGQDGAARFDRPQGIAVDNTGNVLVSDSGNHALRKVTCNGAVSTLAGNGQPGYADGVGSAARFNQPWGIAVDADGVIYVNDSNNNCVRQVVRDDASESSASVSTLAGNAGGKEGALQGAGSADGLGASARFNGPAGLALDTDGHLIVADCSNSLIRRVTVAEGRVTTVAGSPEHGRGFADGEGTAARFNFPAGITVDGNNNILVADLFNNRIRMIVGSAACVTTGVATRV